MGPKAGFIPFILLSIMLIIALIMYIIWQTTTINVYLQNFLVRPIYLKSSHSDHHTARKRNKLNSKHIGFNFREIQVLYVGSLITLFWTSGDVCHGFQSQGGFLACFLVCALFLRFTSDVTPADYIEVSMAAEPFLPMYLQVCPHALVEVQGLNPWPSIPHAESTALQTDLKVYLPLVVVRSVVQSSVAARLWWTWRRKTALLGSSPTRSNVCKFARLDI